MKIYTQEMRMEGITPPFDMEILERRIEDNFKPAPGCFVLPLSGMWKSPKLGYFSIGESLLEGEEKWGLVLNLTSSSLPKGIYSIENPCPGIHFEKYKGRETRSKLFQTAICLYVLAGDFDISDRNVRWGDFLFVRKKQELQVECLSEIGLILYLKI